MQDEIEDRTSCAREKIAIFRRKVRRGDYATMVGSVVMAQVFVWFAADASAVSRIGLLMLASACVLGAVLMALKTGLKKGSAVLDGDPATLLARARECYSERIRFLGLEYWAGLLLILPGMLVNIAGYRDCSAGTKVLASAALAGIAGIGGSLNLRRSTARLRRELADIEGSLEAVGAAEAEAT